MNKRRTVSFKSIFASFLNMGMAMILFMGTPNLVWSFTSLQKLAATGGAETSGSSVYSETQFNAIIHNAVSLSLGNTKLILSASFISADSPDAELYYRVQGDTNTVYTTSAFSNYKVVNNGNSVAGSIKGAPVNSKMFTGRAQLPKEVMVAPGIEYYIVFKGKNKTHTFRSAEDPQTIKIQGEVCASQNMSASGAPGFFSLPLAAMPAGLASLKMTNGSLASGTNVELCLKQSGALPANMRPASNMVLDQTPAAFIELIPDRTQFKKPVELTLGYNDFDQDGIVDDTNISVKALKLFWWDNFEWRMIGGKVNQDEQTVTANLAHFSLYALFAANNNGSIHPKERIITPATQDGINDFANFDGLDGQTFTVKIFDITGRQIKSFSDRTIWDGTNDFGQVVETGAYIYQVDIQGKIYSGVIAVAK